MTSDDGLTAFSSNSAVHKGSRDGRTNPEPELVASLIRGDEEAFVELIGQYHSALLRLAMLYVSDIGAAEEVVQDTWIVVLQGVRKFEGRSSLKTWVFSILLNRARRRGERDNRTVPFSDLVSEEIESPESAVDLAAPDRRKPPSGRAAGRRRLARGKSFRRSSRCPAKSAVISRKPSTACRPHSEP